jgi:glucosamine-6-phosphate deaminase
MNLLTTLPGSLMEGFLPSGWDLARIDRLADLSGDEVPRPERWWNPAFQPVPCASYEDFDTYLGHEIAREIQQAHQAGRPLALILPVGPMGMYRWTVYFLTEWGVPCGHVHGFNMDEWSDAQGNTLPPDNHGAFQYAMEQALYGPLGKTTVPPRQRHFALKAELPTYATQIADLKKQGARLVTVFGIGRVCHIAFWEPQFAGEFATEAAWKAQTQRLGARLHR